MRRFDMLGREKAIIGMVHLAPLPGTPFYEPDSFARELQRGVDSARALHAGGATGCLVQTIDRVYPTGDEVDPARVAAVALVVHEIARATGPEFQIGVQILRNAIEASLAVAAVAGGSFLRCAALVGATMSSEGIVEGRPHAVMQTRRRLDAGGVRLIAEINSMHFKAMDDSSTGDIARSAVRAGADAVSLGHPDEETTLALIRETRAAVPGTPIFLAGYTNHANAARMLAAVDGAFVGTCLEKEGWGSAIDEGKVRAYMNEVRNLPS